MYARLVAREMTWGDGMKDIDIRALAAWLRREQPQLGELRSLEKFASGQSNPTYRMTLESGDYVLRRKPFGQLLPSAHAIEREYRLISALHPVEFPVPQPVVLCEDADAIGAAFYIMSLVEGRNYVSGLLPGVPVADRRAHYESMVDTLARLHSLDHNALGLEDFGRAGNYFSRQVARWSKQYRASQTDDIPEIDKLIDWLPRTVPDQGSSSIIHGDYRVDNLIYAPSAPDVAAVLDWELATIGDPLADLAYLATNWLMPADGGAWLGEVDLQAEGIISLEEVIDRYCAATGRTGITNLNWYFAFNLFRTVGILQGVKKRMLEGNASSSNAEAMLAKIPPLVAEAWRQAQLAGAK